MLHGARGNSGVITSLLFRGIAKGLSNATVCDGVTWAKALKLGVESAYSAVDRPAEGTILTVAKRCAEVAEQASLEKNSFEYVLDAAISEAEKALDDTIKQNPVLEKAGVVDAGGMGWLVVMKAMHQALSSNQKIKFEYNHTEVKQKASFEDFNTEDITFAFCTEFIVKKHNPDEDTSNFKSYLNTMGDSLVMIDDGEIIKTHIHTNEPHAVLGEALKYGVYETVKVENMRTQHTNKLTEAPKEEAVEMMEYGFVSVASGEGLCEIFKELGVNEIVSGGQTMNPSTEDIFNAVNKINAKNIFILPNNKNIIMTSKQVADLTDKNIIVIPTRSVPQGISAMLGFNEECTPKDNEEAMNEMLSTVTTLQITYAARNSNYDGLEIEEGDYLLLCNDKLLKASKSFDDSVMEICEKIKELDSSTVSIYYGCDVTEDDASNLANTIASSTSADISTYSGGQPVYYYIISLE
jgi:DAK2 domain fusion protein YloV